MATPEISVLMSVRNGAGFLPSTLQSLANQRFDPIEFIIVDDGSEDATPGILADWAQRDGRVRIITQSPQASNGLAHALNVGFDHCRAPLIARADVDDLYHSDRLALQYARMQAVPDLAALSCGFRRIDAHGNSLGDRPPLTGSEKIAFTTLFQSSLLHPGAMIRADALRDVGGYDTTYWTAQDSDLWARLIAAGARLDNLPDLLVDYRIHDTSLVRKRGPEGRALSLGVPARMQAAYLGGLPPEHDVAAVVALYQGVEPLNLRRLRRALAGAERILRAARGREREDVLEHARTQFLKGLRQQQVRAARTALPKRLLLRHALTRWQDADFSWESNNALL